MKTRWMVQLLLLLSPVWALYAVVRFSATAPGDALLGTWLNQEKEGKIQIYKQGNQYFGKLVWLKQPFDPATGQPKTDQLNPDESLREAPILGLVLLRDFRYGKENVWEGGKIYDARSGKTYRCKLILRDKNWLDVRGYVGMAWMGLGRTTTWTRAADAKKSAKP
jgi:uncharacterized protein (DUF2147 family)